MWSSGKNLICSESSEKFHRKELISDKLELFTGSFNKGCFFSVHGFTQLEGRCFGEKGKQKYLNFDPLTPSAAEIISEVAVIDKQGIDALIKHISSAKFGLSGWLVEQKLQKIATFVAEYFGGPSATQQTWKFGSELQRDQNAEGVVLLTQLRSGLQLQRALLFKALWDQLPDKIKTESNQPSYRVSVQKADGALPSAYLIAQSEEHTYQINFMSSPVQIFQPTASSPSPKPQKQDVRYMHMLGYEPHSPKQGSLVDTSAPSTGPLPVINLSDSCTISGFEFPIESKSPSKVAFTEDQRFELNDMTNIKKFASGAWADVYRGDWQRHSCFALKRKKDINEKWYLDEWHKVFQNECNILSTYKHDNIIDCRGGLYKDNEFIGIVLQLCEAGSINKIVHSQKAPIPALKQRVHWGLQVAKGMLFLHLNNIVHWDLKVPNLLLDGNKVKIIDFGNAHKIDPTNDLRENFDIIPGTFEYMAPEQFTGGLVASSDEFDSKKIDVYQFGVVLWELVVAKIPFKDQATKCKQLIGEQFKTPMDFDPTPNGLQPEIQELLIQCWKKSPYVRPGFDEIVDQLEHIYAKIE